MARKNSSKTFKLSNNATIDNKLAYASMVMNYAFEYGVNFDSRTITITGEIEHPLFETVDAALTLLENEGKDAITVKIHSPGGDTYEALAIVARLRKSKCQIITEGYGHIMSAATLILACGSKRRLDKNAQFMWHESSYDPGDKKVSQHEAQLLQAKREEEIWAENMALYSNKPKKFWKEKGIGLDSFFSSEELLKMGVIDEVF
jgi:ATP-dependent Clp protease protease subunit